MVVASILCQLLGIYLMPLTKGLTQALPTIWVGLIFLIGIGLMIRASSTGMSIGFLMPLFGAMIPLGSIAIDVLLYKNNIPFPKLAVLVVASGLIGFAGTL
jgi:multidrug transporter EmrE-like cation transporter